MGIPFTSTRWQIPEEGRKTRPLPNLLPLIMVPEHSRREEGERGNLLRGRSFVAYCTRARDPGPKARAKANVSAPYFGWFGPVRLDAGLHGGASPGKCCGFATGGFLGLWR